MGGEGEGEVRVVAGCMSGMGRRGGGAAGRRGGAWCGARLAPVAGGAELVDKSAQLRLVRVRVRARARARARVRVGVRVRIGVKGKG